jgi:hypothetical protein
MAEQDSTLACWRIGGQLDRSVCDPDGVWADIRVTCTLVNPAGGAVVDPSNGAHIVIMNEILVIGGTADTIVVKAAADDNATVTADRQWYSRELKPNTATNPDLALQPSGTYWAVKLEANARRKQWVTVYETNVVLDGGRNYVTEGETQSITIDAVDTNVVKLTALEPPLVTDPPTDAFTTAVLAVVTPLYTITGYTATLPGSEVAVANYASMTALLAAVPPTHQGQRIQVAGAPILSAVGNYEGRWIAGAWAWEEV